MCDPSLVGLGFADQWRKARLQVSDRLLIEAVIDLACID
jgi:hypothetical protein